MNAEQLGNITLYNGDCMDVLKQTPDKYYDLCIVDPPYGINVNVNMGRRKGDASSNYHKFHGGDKMPPDESYFKELIRISKNQIIWGANHFISKMPFDSSCWLVWDKGFSNDVTFASCELAWTSFNTTVKKYFKNPNGDQTRIHPTEKPIQLYKWLLQNYAKQGDTILDTHFGSLSIGIACHDMGFDLTAIELDKDYYEAGKKRLQLHQRQLTIF